jgi:hypothetical protein
MSSSSTLGIGSLATALGAGATVGAATLSLRVVRHRRARDAHSLDAIDCGAILVPALPDADTPCTEGPAVTRTGGASGASENGSSTEEEGVLEAERWGEIRRMRFVERLSIREIARRTGHDRKTVQRAVRSDVPPSYVRPSRRTARAIARASISADFAGLTLAAVRGAHQLRRNARDAGCRPLRRAPAFAGQKLVGDGHERDVVVPAAVAAAFEVVEAERVLELAVVVFDAPAQLAHLHQFGQRRVGGQPGQPVVGGLVGIGGPFGQQPADGQLAASVGGSAAQLDIGRAHARRHKPRGHRPREPSRHVTSAAMSAPAASSRSRSDEGLAW